MSVLITLNCQAITFENAFLRIYKMIQTNLFSRLYAIIIYWFCFHTNQTKKTVSVISAFTWSVSCWVIKCSTAKGQGYLA